MIIEIAPGDRIPFSDSSCMHHANEPLIGHHGSIVAFAQENIYDY